MGKPTLADDKKKVIIVPCSGIGKTYGSVSREAAYELVENVRPDQTRLVPLSLLVLGDHDSQQALAQNPAVTIDGCKLACANKMVLESGGEVAKEFAVLDVYRKHRQLKPRGIAELNQAGKELARALAEEAADVVDELNQGVQAGADNEGRRDG
jgi:uncharacterized metal-binding protein